MPCPCEVIDQCIKKIFPYIIGGFVIIGVIDTLLPNVTYDNKLIFQALLVIAILCIIAFIIIPMLADQIYHIDMDKPLEYENDQAI